MTHRMKWISLTAAGFGLAALACDGAAGGDASSDDAASGAKPTTAPSAGFVYTLPKGVDVTAVTGLDVTVKAIHVGGNDPVMLDFSADALRPTTGPTTRPTSIGDYTTFKPIKAGESLTASVRPPPASAWVLSSDGARTVVHFEMKSVIANRVAPDVEFKIIGVKPALEK